MTPQAQDRRIPAQVFCLADLLCEEMQARGWTTADVALRMGDRRDYGANKFIIDLAMAVQEDGLLYDDETIRGLAAAFGVSEAYLRALDKVWRDNPDRRVPFEAPEEIYGRNERAVRVANEIDRLRAELAEAKDNDAMWQEIALSVQMALAPAFPTKNALSLPPMNFEDAIRKVITRAKQAEAQRDRFAAAMAQHEGVCDRYLPMNDVQAIWNEAIAHHRAKQEKEQNRG